MLLRQLPSTLDPPSKRSIGTAYYTLRRCTLPPIHLVCNGYHLDSFSGRWVLLFPLVFLRSRGFTPSILYRPRMVLLILPTLGFRSSFAIRYRLVLLGFVSYGFLHAHSLIPPLRCLQYHRDQGCLCQAILTGI